MTRLHGLRWIVSSVVVALGCGGLFGCGAPLGQGGAQARPEERVRHAGLAGLPDSERQALTGSGIDPADLRCNTKVRWSTTLRAEAKAGAAELLAAVTGAGVTLAPEEREILRKAATDLLFWRMVLAGLIDGDQNNLGVVPLQGIKTSDGRDVLLYRSGFTPRPGQAGSCVESLVRHGGVRHAVNLYAGPMPTADLESGERRTLTAAGGTYRSARDAGPDATQWREDLREGTDPEARQKAMIAVAGTIRDLLQPGGEAPRGNVLVHCGGGMHRTGMVVGILERCINGASPDAVAASFRRHVAWRSDQEPGGFEADNLEFIEAFDCALLR